MTQKEFNKVLQYCRVIGIETLADLQRFNKEEREKGESLAAAFERYAAEVKNK